MWLYDLMVVAMLALAVLMLRPRRHPPRVRITIVLIDAAELPTQACEVQDRGDRRRLADRPTRAACVAPPLP